MSGTPALTTWARQSVARCSPQGLLRPRYEEFELERVCHYVAAPELRSPRQSPLGAGAIEALACDALWPKDRAIAFGCQLGDPLS
eukprot:7477996-Pyramimonas_sp.AAC.1